MMRDILFRGKRVELDLWEESQWIEGSLLELDADSGYVYIMKPFHSASTLPPSAIISHNLSIVHPESVGQYTGLTDISGKRIFEGDIVEIHVGDLLKVGIVFYGAQAGRYGVSIRGEDNYSFMQQHLVKNYAIRVIGNKFDDREILLGGDG